MYELIGRTALVTGASSGIGEAVARLFAREGARLILCARRRDRLNTLADQLRSAHGSEVLEIGLDVSDRTAVIHRLSTLPPPFHNVDILINNAGLSRGMAPVHQGSAEDWEEMLRTNVHGLLHVTRTILPGMAARGKGDVVNLGSISSHEVYPGGAVYCATKHAVDALSRGMRMDLMNTPLRIIQISPGMVETEFSVVRFRGDHDQADRVYQGLEPLRPEDVADSVLWAITRPAHVQVGEIVLWPTAQAGATLIHRASRESNPPPSVPPDESTWKAYYELEDDRGEPV